MEFTGNPNFGGSSQCENNWKYLKIIENIPLSRLLTGDRDGWHFTNNGRYTAKYDYQVKRVYPDRERTLSEYGPSVVPLKAFCWKIRCPPKMKHFYGNWYQDVIAVKRNLRARWTRRYSLCTMWSTWGIHKSCVFFFNVHRRFMFGHSHEFHRIQTSFPPNHSLQTWIICFAGFLWNWKIINLHGSYGTYGKEETTKYLAIWILILEILSNWQKLSHYFGLRHIFHLHKESIKLDYQ